MTDAPAAPAAPTMRTGADAPSEARPMDAAAEDAGLAPSQGVSRVRPLLRLVLWTAGLGALVAAGVAIIAGAAAGWHGVVLLGGLAAAAMLVLYALAAGDAAGRALRGGEDGRVGCNVRASVIGDSPNNGARVAREGPVLAPRLGYSVEY